MKRRKAVMGLVAVLFFAVGRAQAATLTFEDVPGGSLQSSSGDMPGYGGFIFSNQLDWIDLVGPSNYSFNYRAHSGQFAVHKAFSGTTVIHAVGGVDFTFDGLWAKKWDTAPESGGVDDLFGTLSGTNNGNLMWSVNTGLNGSYEYYGAQAGAIDTLVLGFGDRFIVDDLSLNAASAPVPEPTSLALWSGLGFMGLIAILRRPRRASSNK